MHKLMQWLGIDPALRHSAGRRRIDLGDDDPTYPIYVIGDVHGCLDELKAAEQRVKDDLKGSGQRALIVLLGDYVDRGPASADVIDHLSSGPDPDIARIALCGNHDDVFLKYLKRQQSLHRLLELGGQQTLLSYGIDIREIDRALLRRPNHVRDLLTELMPQFHLGFLESLPVLLRIGRYVFVHAGLRPGVPLADQRDEDLMWIREPFLTDGPDLPYLVIHGHTPCSEIEFKPSRIAVDTGAYFSRHLSVLKIDGGEGSVI
ncbi:serine/threonine protein phosphatase 1 [Rhizobium sp. NFR07]|uniref:metallophosphoesterase family protein n=1 Tax=Rhizobium sp. NFR07 TaxID=1566262 RepID=UPI0008E1A875|nr:metallophosphoesterase family protein [Rhizobium sp. NFR07]SFB62968.1 serine/threonine protein phosphatase 1 [Rhizobium sp. NFR07]